MLRRSGRLLILDMGEVSFCDEAALAVLVGIQHRAVALGLTVRLSFRQSAVLRTPSCHGPGPGVHRPDGFARLGRSSRRHRARRPAARTAARRPQGAAARPGPVGLAALRPGP
ncbi:STAS domain-containing protein [Actinomadura sp. LOL_016]|uniref:STAS domain-containing protein n=1 Tax=unclassified Actinomadura TaxID=2626254 RepID=UPI003A805F11